jgi:hypothetical protein
MASCTCAVSGAAGATDRSRLMPGNCTAIPPALIPVLLVAPGATATEQADSASTINATANEDQSTRTRFTHGSFGSAGPLAANFGLTRPCNPYNYYTLILVAISAARRPKLQPEHDTGRRRRAPP